MGHDGNGMRMPEKWSNPGGRNMRNWWARGPEPRAAAHFATFPSSIPRKTIAASTSERGCCPECGAPWRRIVARQRFLDSEVPVTGSFSRPDEPFRVPANGIGHWRYTTEGPTIGWQPTCRHYDDRYRSEFPKARRRRSGSSAGSRAIGGDACDGGRASRIGRVCLLSYSIRSPAQGRRWRWRGPKAAGRSESSSKMSTCR